MVDTKNTNIIIEHPAHLWIGSHEQITVAIIYALQKLLCSAGGCTYCGTCLALHRKAHHQLLWIEPETSYTREIVQPFFDTMALQRDPNTPFFTVLAKADTLTPVTANSLLKFLEEPPYGYHCILTTDRLSVILPTIRSRCIIHTVSCENSSVIHQSLYDHFTGAHQLSAIEFLKIVEDASLSEQESIVLVDALIAHWKNSAVAALKNNNSPSANHAQQIFTLICAAYQKPPLSGSSKLFWKNIYIKTMSLLYTTHR